MKLFGNDITRSRILQALFGWSLCLPSKQEPAKPFEGKIASAESDDEVWAEPLVIADNSILRQTDPLLMTKKERYESTIRYWMEWKGYSPEDVAKPLTDERMKEIGRVGWKDYEAAIQKRKQEYATNPVSCGLVAQAMLLEKPNDLDSDALASK